MCLPYLKLLIYFSLLILIKGENDCGMVLKPNNNRIVGGEVIGYVKYPWYAALVRATDVHSLVCGGTLISKKFILTAAHCYKPYFEKEKQGTVKLKDIYLAKLGVNNICIREADVQTISISEVHIQEKYYDDRLYYDIALVVLELEVNNYMPACLPPARYDSNNRTGLEGTVIGLGKESARAWRLPCQVKETNVEVQPDSICRSFLSANGQDGDALHDAFCAGDGLGMRDTCQGDSGGPLLVPMLDDRIMVLGVTSFGFGCAEKKTYGVYTDVSHFLDWIHNTMNSVQKSVAKSEHADVSTPSRGLSSTTGKPEEKPATSTKKSPQIKPKKSTNILQQILNW